MKSHLKKILTVLGALVILSACGNPAQELKIAGGTAHLEMMEIMALRVMKENPSLKISVAAGGSGLGIKQAGEGIIDIGNSGRALKPEEAARYDLEPYRFAIDGIALAVHPENPVKNLTQEQAKKVFSGQITRWSELGSKDRPIHLYSRDTESGTRQTFQELLMGQDQISLQAQFVASNGQMKAMIGKDPDAIGYLSAGHLDESVKALEINGIYPSFEKIQEGTYPVQRGLYMMIKKNAPAHVKAFVERFLSPEGQALVKEKHFIPVP